MNTERIREKQWYVENVAAELTEAAYPVAMRRGVSGSSIDFELHLWKAMGEAVKQWECPSATEGK